MKVEMKYRQQAARAKDRPQNPAYQKTVFDSVVLPLSHWYIRVDSIEFLIPVSCLWFELLCRFCLC